MKNKVLNNAIKVNKYKKYCAHSSGGRSSDAFAYDHTADSHTADTHTAVSAHDAMRTCKDGANMLKS